MSVLCVATCRRVAWNICECVFVFVQRVLSSRDGPSWSANWTTSSMQTSASLFCHLSFFVVYYGRCIKEDKHENVCTCPYIRPFRYRQSISLIHHHARKRSEYWTYTVTSQDMCCTRSCYLFGRRLLVSKLILFAVDIYILRMNVFHFAFLLVCLCLCFLYFFV